MLKAPHDQSPSRPPQRGGEVTSKFAAVRFVRWVSSTFGRVNCVSLFIFFFLFITTSIAQVKDTALSPKKLDITNPNKQADSLAQIITQPKTTTTYHSPKKAALMSTIIPGSGQIYNKKYWKVPVIYAGLAGLAYSINFNQTRYIKYRTAFK